ncbi:hypothetical protein [Desulfosporosinus sp. I2]|uniref:hypothetical protein n=1 Tax=Desulfosporosinus sp. I2 TaxID=1617025 RepID=UPI0005F0BE79|nr:hypothetical protein [Desulfosporosinus sp. I2]
MKKLIPILLCIFMLLGTQVALGATETKLSGSGVVSPAAFQYISGGQCKIVNNGNGTINISGSTSTYTAVQQIGLQLNLQYLSGGQWVTLNTYSYTNYSSANVSGGKLLTVSGGYNYRVFAQHTSLNGGISESGQSYSEAVYIQ